MINFLNIIPPHANIQNREAETKLNKKVTFIWNF